MHDSDDLSTNLPFLYYNNNNLVSTFVMDMFFGLIAHDSNTCVLKPKN